MTSQHLPADTEPGSGGPPKPRGSGLRPVLWIALALGVAANLITALASDNPWYSGGSGLVVLSCALGLGLLARRAARLRRAGE